MASGLSRYLTPDSELDPANISMEDLEAIQNPMGVVPVPTATKEQDLAELYDQEMRKAALKEDESAAALQQYIRDYSAQPRGVDWSPAAAFFQNQALMQAAQSLKPPSMDEKSQTIMNLQGRLADKLGGASKLRLQALAKQIDAKQRAEKAAVDESSRREQLAIEKKRMDQLDEYRRKELGLREQMANLGFNARQASKDQGLQQREEARFDRDIQAMEKRVGDIAPGIATKLENLDQLLPGGLAADIEEPVEGAGVGKFLIPDWAMSNEASEIQQNARGLAADLIKLQSGTAASDKEVDRKLKELGMAPGSKSSTFRAGLGRLKNQFTNELKNKEAGFDPKVKAAYQERGGITHERIMDIGQKPKASASDVDQKLKRLQELRQKAGQ